MQAQYTINLSVNGTFGSASCPTPPCDQLALAGKAFTMTGSVLSNQTVIPLLTLGITGLPPVGIANAPVSVAAGNPGSVTISASVTIGTSDIVFSAVAKLPNIAESQPYPFGARTIGSGSSSTYGTVGGTNPTTLSITGTVLASTTEPMSASPTTFNFTAQPGGASQSQPLTVSAAGGATATFALAVGSSAASWLSVSAAAGTTPATPNVTVNPASLAAGNYTGTITLSSGAAPVSTPTITVNLTVTAPVLPTITPSPGSLTFNYQLLQSAPGTQPISLTSSGANVAYSVAAGAPSWLSIANGGGTTPGPITVGINTAGLTAQTYNYTITVNLTGASSPSVTVPVTLNVTAAPTLSAPTTPLNFSYQTGGAAPGPQSVSVTASGGASIAFTATASVTTPSGGSWLSAAAGGTTPGSQSISVTPGSLAAGTYSGTVTISSTKASNSVTIPVNLTISAQPVLVANPTSLTFSYQIGGTVPPAQNLAISVSGGSAVSYTLQTAGGSWLSLTSTSGSTPGNTSVQMNVNSLTGGVYNGSVTITASGVANSPLTVPVTLTVSAEPALSAVPSALTFSYQVGGVAPVAQSLAVNASGAASLSFTLATSGSWLSAVPGSGTTNATAVSVSVNPAGLSSGTYNSSITITSPGAANTGLKVPVTLTVTAGSVLSTVPVGLTFSYQVGGAAPVAQSLAVNASGAAALNFTLATSGSWLSAVPGGGTTNATSVNVSVNPSALSPGAYNGSITITSSGASNSGLKVPVTLTVTAAPTISLTPSIVHFIYQIGGAAPAAQTLAVGGSAGINYSVSVTTNSGGGWLTAGPNGATPGNIIVQAAGAALGAGTYTGTITVSSTGASNSPLTVTADLTVSAGPLVSAAPGNLTFQVAQGGKAPASQTIAIGSSAGALNFTVASSAAWLKVTPTNGATPASLTVSVDPANLTPATYKGTITVTAPGASNSPVNVAVNLVISSPSAELNAISDAASGTTVSISPGSIVSLWGTLLGPTAPVFFQLSADGTVANILANTQVFFDETPATLLYVSDKQINAIVPYEVAGKTTTKVRIEYLGVQSDLMQVDVTPTAPALFTVGETGKGQGAILNHDLSVNSTKNPASKGSVVVLYGEGCGQTDPPGTDGSVTGNVLAHLVLPLTVQIGGVDAPVVKFSGAAPGLVAGVVQINVEVPQQTSSGEVPVVISVGGKTSQPGVTLAIR